MFWSRPPVRSKQLEKDNVQRPKLCESPATSSPSESGPATTSRAWVQTASTELPTAETTMYSPKNGTCLPPNGSTLGIVKALLSSWCVQVAPPPIKLEH